jgi:outer membrane protein assembly factor BamB
MYRRYIYIFFLLVFITNNSIFSQLKNRSKNTNWPGFRGLAAAGIAEGYSTPVSWDVETGKNIKWKTEIFGLGHSSPVVWKDRIFITTAISGKNDPEMKVGLYGDIEPVDDETIHTWKVFCLNKKTGKMIWEKTACTGIPKIKRHPKSTHANPTVATDGKHVVAFFGSEGLYCYNMDGQLLWEKDLGVLNSTFFLFPGAQWGFASSPIIHENSVIVQCDVLKNSFIASFNVESGKEIWRTPRDEFPTWGTPTVFTKKNMSQIVVNGFKHIGGYDFETGKEIWKMKGGGDIPVPTPVIAHDLIFINNAHGKMSPIYAIKTNARGDISLAKDKSSNEFIVWSIKRGGAYMQTPLIYGDYLYNLRGNGTLTCFNAKTGALIYKEKVGKLASFSASVVAGDNKIYCPGEKGDIYVVQAGTEFKLHAQNEMNDICMATPAISEGVLFFRTHHYLIAIEEK